MLEKWLNQWAIRAMPALGTLEVRPQTLAKVISAIQYHHSTSSSLPSSHLMRALINLISNNLRHKTERANVPCSALLLEGSISAALCLQEPNLASPQVVQIMTSLSSLGVSNVMQDGESKGFCSLLFSVIDLDKISTPLVLDALVAVSVMVDVKVRPAGKDKELSDWMVKAARALPLTDLESKANDAARLLSSLAVLSAFVERESIVQVSEVIEASSANLMIKEDGVGVADGLTLPNAVDAMWGLAQLSSLQLSLPPSQAFVTSLTSYLDGKIGILNATQLKRLISGLSSPSLCYQPSSSLALELSRAAVSRFSSSSVPASELADVVWNFAVLSCDLPPSFAASAQRRLQAAMKDLDAPSLAKMMWSLAKSNYLPSEPQLRAYASRVTAVLDGMIKLEDLSRSLEAFVLFNHRLDHNAVVRAVAISLPLLSEAGDVKRGSTIASLARSILWHANGSTVLTDSNQWVKALTSALDSQALDSLTSSEVCSLLSTLARVGPSEESKDGFDILKLLSRLPATSDLNAMNCQDLVKVMSIWKESLSPNDPNTLHVVKDLPVRIQQKLAAYSATDSAALLTSLTTLASSTRLLPLFERTTLTSLMGDLAAKATGAIPALSTSDVALLVAAVSQSRAVMLSSSSSVSADLTDDRVTDLLTLSLTRIKDDLDRLRDQDLVMLMEALSRESEEAAGLRSRMVKNGRKAPEASALQVKKDQELRALVRRISVVLGEVMASERRLSAMQPEMFARFIGSYCKHLKFGSYSLLLTKEEEEEEKRREKGEVAAAHNGIRGPSEPRQVLESSLNVMRARMESGSLAGWEHVAIIARAIASSGAVPSAAWIGAMKQAVRITQAPEPGPATSLLYSFVCWQADPGRDFASLLLAGAFRLNSSSPAPDPSLVLLGYSHCSTFGYRVDNEVILNEFVSNRLIPSLPAMNAEQIATVATSLSSFKGSQNLRDEIRAAVDQALVSVDWDVFSSHLIAQVALNLIAVRNNRSGGVHWISAALDSVRGRKDGAIAVKHLQDLQSLQ